MKRIFLCLFLLGCATGSTTTAAPAESYSAAMTEVLRTQGTKGLVGLTPSKGALLFSSSDGAKDADLYFKANGITFLIAASGWVSPIGIQDIKTAVEAMNSKTATVLKINGLSDVSSADLVSYQKNARSYAKQFNDAMMKHLSEKEKSR